MKEFVKYIAKLTLYLLLFLSIISLAIAAIFLFYPHYLWTFFRLILIVVGAGIGLFCAVTLVRLLIDILRSLNKEQKFTSRW